MKKVFILILTFTLLLTHFSNVMAQNRPLFSIKPEDTKTSYFDLTLNPGESFSNRLVAINHTTDVLKLNLAAVDGVTALNGGISFTFANTTGTSRWITMENQGIVEIPSGNLIRIPFTINIPADTQPGEYVAGFLATVAEGPMKKTPTQSEGSSFNVDMITQVGISVIIHVPGPQVCKIEISDITNVLDFGKWSLGIVIKNTGNIHFNGSGQIIVKSVENNEEVWNENFSLGYTIPKDTVNFPISIRKPLDGKYQVNAVITSIKDPNCSAKIEKIIEIGEQDVQDYAIQTTQIAQSQAENTILTPDRGPTNNLQPTLQEKDQNKSSIPWLTIIGILFFLASLVFFVLSQNSLKKAKNNINKP